MDIYCINCKYLSSYEAEGGIFEYTCQYPLNIVTKFNAIQSWQTKQETPWELNIINNCQWYKRKWYKFWIRK